MRTSISNIHTCVAIYFSIEIQMLRNGKLSSLSCRSSGRSSLQWSPFCLPSLLQQTFPALCQQPAWIIFINFFFVMASRSPCNRSHFLVGERAKRARRYLVMSMESRDIYIRTSVSNTHARVSVL